MCDRLIELPNHGRLIVVTDLHGNFDDYAHYLNLWDETDPDFHIVFCGDLIHGLDGCNRQVRKIFQFPHFAWKS